MNAYTKFEFRNGVLPVLQCLSAWHPLVELWSYCMTSLHQARQCEDMLFQGMWGGANGYSWLHVCVFCALEDELSALPMVWEQCSSLFQFQALTYWSRGVTHEMTDLQHNYLAENQHWFWTIVPLKVHGLFFVHVKETENYFKDNHHECMSFLFMRNGYNLTYCTKCFLTLFIQEI